MKSILIVYKSKYGATKQIINTVAKALEPGSVITPNMFGSEYFKYDSVLIASGVYSESLHPDILAFMKKNQKWLLKKRVGLLGVALGPERLNSYLISFKNQLKGALLWIGTAHGRLRINSLSADDSSLLKSFSERLGMPFIDRDFMNQGEIQTIVEELQKFFSN